MSLDALDFSDQRAVRDLLRQMRAEIAEDLEQKKKLESLNTKALDVLVGTEAVVSDRVTVEIYRPLFGGWYDQLGSDKILSRDEQMKLGRRIEAGIRAERILSKEGSLDERKRLQLSNAMREGRAAQESMVQRNLRLVRSLAFAYRNRTPRFDLDDVFESGVIGLMTAARKFDWRRGYAFSTYATWWIRQSMSRYWMNTSPQVHLPVHVWSMFDRPKKGDDQWTLKENIEASDDTFAALGILNGVRSLDDMDCLDQENALRLAKRLSGEVNSEVGERLRIESMAKVIDLMTRHLTERDKGILRDYYGIGAESEMSLEAVGKIYGLTRERVRQILAHSIGSIQQLGGRSEHIMLLEASIECW